MAPFKPPSVHEIARSPACLTCCRSVHSRVIVTPAWCKGFNVNPLEVGMLSHSVSLQLLPWSRIQPITGWPSLSPTSSACWNVPYLASQIPPPTLRGRSLCPANLAGGGFHQAYHVPARRLSATIVGTYFPPAPANTPTDDDIPVGALEQPHAITAIMRVTSRRVMHRFRSPFP